MTQKLTKVKNGSISLLQQIKKQWQGATVFVSGSGDTLLVKRVSQPVLSLKIWLKNSVRLPSRLNSPEKTLPGPLLRLDMKAVFDTNVLVSGLFFGGTLAKALTLIDQGLVSPCFTPSKLFGILPSSHRDNS